MIAFARRAQVVAAGPWLELGSILRSAMVALAVITFGTLAGHMLDAEYTNRALPGLSVGGIPVGSLDADALRARLTQAVLEWRPRAIEVLLVDRAWLASDSSLGLAPDLDAAMRSALTYGKEGPFALRVAAWARALTGSVELALPLRSASADGGARLALWVEAVAASAERPVREGSLTIDEDGVRVTAPQVGRYVDRVALARALQTAPGMGDRRIALPVRDVHPTLEAVHFGEAVALARTALGPLSVTAAGVTVDVEPQTLAAFMSIRQVALAAVGPTGTVDGAFVPATRTRLEIGVEEPRLSEAVAKLSVRLGRPARDAGYAALANGTFAVLGSTDGAAVDRTALAALLRRAVTDPAGPRTTVVATIPVPPRFSTVQAEADAQELTRVGFAERYHGSERTTSVPDLVLPPGESVGASVAGELAVGPAEALFAAALAAGYAVEGAVPGWRNDTAHPVLARSSVTARSTAWELWSVPPRRQVTFGPSTNGSIRRTVTEAGEVLSSALIPERFGPLQNVPQPGQTNVVTAAPNDR